MGRERDKETEAGGSVEGRSGDAGSFSKQLRTALTASVPMRT